MTNIGKKIFEEVDFPTDSRIISEDKDKSIIVMVMDALLFLKMVSLFQTGKVFLPQRTGKKFPLLEKIQARMANTM
jgi:hypothetical protein